MPVGMPCRREKNAPSTTCSAPSHSNPRNLPPGERRRGRQQQQVTRPLWTVPDVQTEVWGFVWAGADTTCTSTRRNSASPAPKSKLTSAQGRLSLSRECASNRCSAPAGGAAGGHDAMWPVCAQRRRDCYQRGRCPARPPRVRERHV